MPTTVTSKIGATNSPTTMDYTTLQSWEDACPANLVTDDKIWKGECYDQGEFTVAGYVLTISGETTDATRYIWLTCAAGASFKDNAAVRSTALDYNASNGVAARRTSNYGQIFSVTVRYCRIVGMQLKGDGSSGGISSSAGNLLVDACIIRLASTAAFTIGIYNSSSNPGTYLNTLFICNTSAQITIINDVNAGTLVAGCTFVNSHASPSGSSIAIDISNYGGAANETIKNCAIFGFPIPIDGNNAVAASYNATNISSIQGSNNQTSLTFASQFVSTTNDFRAVDTGSLDLNGTPDATNIPTDISGTTRHASTPTIGCWEVVAAVASYFFPKRRRRKW